MLKRALASCLLLLAFALPAQASGPVPTAVGSNFSNSSVQSLSTGNLTATAPAHVAIICVVEISTAGSSAWSFSDSVNGSTGWVTAGHVLQTGVGDYVVGYNLNPGSAVPSGTGSISVSWTTFKSESFISCESVTNILAFDGTATPSNSGAGTAVTLPSLTYTTNLEFGVGISTDAASGTTASTFTNGSVQRARIDDGASPNNAVFFHTDDVVSGHSGGAFNWGYTYSGSTNRFVMQWSFTAQSGSSTCDPSIHLLMGVGGC